jgi:hypothetical protein
LDVGLRLEHDAQRVDTFDLFSEDAVSAELSLLDLMPAANVTFPIVDDEMQVRLGLSRTVNRPTVRELSPNAFTDDARGVTIVGEPNLTRASVINADARWEWFFGADELLALTGFLGATPQMSFANAQGAQNLGLELEGRGSIGRIWRRLRYFYAGANLALVRSRIRIGDDAARVINNTNQTRPLQGQSPYTFNLQLEYDDPEGGLRAAVLYNLVGRRIDEVGVDGLPDIYEEPSHRLDVVLAWPVGAGLTLGFKGRNLLDWPSRFTQGGYETRSARRGIDFSLSIAYRG